MLKKQYKDIKNTINKLENNNDLLEQLNNDLQKVQLRLNRYNIYNYDYNNEDLITGFEFTTLNTETLSDEPDNNIILYLKQMYYKNFSDDTNDTNNENKIISLFTNFSIYFNRIKNRISNIITCDDIDINFIISLINNNVYTFELFKNQVLYIFNYINNIDSAHGVKYNKIWLNEFNEMCNFEITIQDVIHFIFRDIINKLENILIIKNLF